ncbi:MAG: hypothetical protein IBX40_09375 [Methanosarcinales archaeon]|nr:hypothetical protein [Methanosarcinales archaeon]
MCDNKNMKMHPGHVGMGMHHGHGGMGMHHGHGGMDMHQGQCSCGFHGSFSRHLKTKQEMIGGLEEYQQQLELELQAVKEHLDFLKNK